MIAGPSTDTTKKRLAPGFVVTEPATKMNPWLKEWASQFPVTQEGISNGVNAITTNGEVFVPKLGVEAAGNGSFELGVMRLREMNNKPKEGGHASIDRLIAMSTLQGLKPMTMGGEITPNYSGGGLTGYENGGRVIPHQMFDGSLGQSSRVDPNTNMPLYDARQVVSVPAEEVGGGSGLRYYGGMETGNKIENAIEEAYKLALSTAETSPQDSIPADMVKKFLKPRKKGLMGLLGFQQGDLTGYQDGNSVLPQNLSELMSVEEERLGAVPMSLYIRQLQGLQNPEQEILAGILGTTPKLNQSPELPKYRSEELEPVLTGYQDGDKVSGLSKLLSMITPKGRRQRSYEEMVPQDMLPMIDLDMTPIGSPDLFTVVADEDGYVDPEKKFERKALIRMLQGRPPEPQDLDLTGYENGGTTFEDAVIAARTPFYNLKPNPDTGMYDIQSIAGIAGDSGRNYYIGRGSAESPSAAAQAAHLMALKNSMSGEPMDIDPSDVGSYFKPKKKGLMGLLGFQDGDMVGPPVPPQMMGEQGNQQLGDSIDMRMANPQVGGAIGVMRQESEAIEAAMKDNIARNARLALQKMKLDSIMQTKPQGMSIPDSLITNPQSLDSSILRLLQDMNQSRGVRIPRPSTLR